MTSHHLLWTAGGMAVIWVMAGTKDAGMSGAGATPLIGTVDVTPPDPTPTQKYKSIQTLPSSTHQQNLPDADSVLCFFERGLLILVHEKRHPHDDHQDKEVLGDGVALSCYQDAQHHHWDGLDGLPQHLQQSTNQSVSQSREKLLLNIHGGK